MMDQSRASTRKLDASAFRELLGEWAEGAGPLYEQLAAAISRLCATGILRAGHQLPPERATAQALNVSRGTVVRAYDALAAAETVTRVQGSGTTVNGNEVSTSSPETFIGERLWEGVGESIDLLKATPTVLDETLELIDRSDLRALRSELDSAEPLGLWSLRCAVAEWYGRQGLETTPHQILITSGAQQALSLAIATMVRPGDVVLGEEDTWPGLIDAVRMHGGQFEPVLGDRHGLDVDDLERQIRRFMPAMIAINPQFQNPTGTCLPPERVARVAELIRTHRVPLIEDRVAANLGFDGRYRAPVASFDDGGWSWIADSLSKVAWQGLRLGWIRADAQFIQRVRPNKAISDMFTPLLSQAAGFTFLEHYDEQVQARIRQLRPRADAVVAGLEALPGWTFDPPRGGLSAWAKLPGSALADAFAQHATRYGVQLATCRSFAICEADVGHIRIPFTAPIPTLEEGMQRIQAAWRTFVPSSAPLTVI